tara:strand:+ start:350 stop:541 length:192 start_codon:yes stop_codon:yes gene_type:complete
LGYVGGVVGYVPKKINMEVKVGDIIIFESMRKKVIGIHTNNNVILKINGTLVQVFREKVSLIK